MATQRTLLDGNTGQKFDSLELLAGQAQTVVTGGLPVGTLDFSPLVWDNGTQQWINSALAVLDVINPSGSTLFIGGSAIQIDGVTTYLARSGGGQGAVAAQRNGGTSAPEVGFFDTPPVGQPTITGSRGGNAALASLLTELAALGLIVDGTSA